eukprot:11525216-Alexandrium_andersonii.AAC.1
MAPSGPAPPARAPSPPSRNTRPPTLKHPTALRPAVAGTGARPGGGPQGGRPLGRSDGEGGGAQQAKRGRAPSSGWSLRP